MTGMGLILPMRSLDIFWRFRMNLYIKEGKLPDRCLDCAFLKPPYAYDSWVCAAKKFCDYRDIRVPDSAVKDRNCPLEVKG